ncbi:MAG: thiol-disulfide oxidoreductase DCC family protein [Pseudonocardiaceae bacterium]
MPRDGGVLVFDGYCGFCTRAVHAVLRLDRRGRVRALPLQGPRVLALTGITREQALHEAWWVAVGGTRLGGAEALTAAVSAAVGIPLGWLHRTPGLRVLLDWVYRWVAEHRRLLRGVAPYCVAHPCVGCEPGRGRAPGGPGLPAS